MAQYLAYYNKTHFYQTRRIKAILLLKFVHMDIIAGYIQHLLFSTQHEFVWNHTRFLYIYI